LLLLLWRRCLLLEALEEAVALLFSWSLPYEYVEPAELLDSS
jgi:hypothetical protein